MPMLWQNMKFKQVGLEDNFYTTVFILLNYVAYLWHNDIYTFACSSLLERLETEVSISSQHAFVSSMGFCFFHSFEVNRLDFLVVILIVFMILFLQQGPIPQLGSCFSYDFLVEVLFVTIYLKFLTVDEHGSVIYLTMGMLFAFQFQAL